MLLKYKSFLVGLVLMLGVALALCVSSISARADTTVSNGGTNVYLGSTNFEYNTVNISTYGTIDFSEQFESNGVYYSTFSSTTEILVPYRFNTRTPLLGSYVTGRTLLQDTLSITVGSVTGFTLSNLKYTCALIFNSDNDVVIGMHHTGNAYYFGFSFNDYLVTNSYRYNSWTLSIRIYGLAQWSGSVPHRTASIPISINHSLSQGTENLDKFLIPYESTRISKGIDNSEDIETIIGELQNVNAHMVWSDGVVVYDLADLMYMNFASQNTANNWLDQIAQASHNTENTVDNIASNISTDNSGIASSIGSGASSLHTGESNVEGQIDDILADVIGPSDDFNQALDDIGDVNVGAFVNTHTVPLGFWHNVTQWFIDTSSMGIFSKFLLIILVLGLVTWILAI